MKISRLSYDPGSALDFYLESLEALGALCERTWHDRLDVVAQGQVATLWNPQGELHAQELLFAPADAQAARDPGREVFPGCPLTFQIAQLLHPSPLQLEKVVLRPPTHPQAPEPAVLEKLWRAQFASTRHWRLASALRPAFHLSLVAVIRCEIQAIDQHWSLHRIAVSLPDGQPDEALAQQVPLFEPEPEPPPVDWVLPREWWSLLQRAFREEIEPDLKALQARQEQYLERELQRIDAYFADYQAELTRRTHRLGAAAAVKTQDRLAAARAEHARRRNDQVLRHEIRAQPHLDALLCVAEPAWQAIIEVAEDRTLQHLAAIFVPRARKWFQNPAGATEIAAPLRPDF